LFLLPYLSVQITKIGAKCVAGKKGESFCLCIFCVVVYLVFAFFSAEHMAWAEIHQVLFSQISQLTIFWTGLSSHFKKFLLPPTHRATQSSVAVNQQFSVSNFVLNFETWAQSYQQKISVQKKFL
jgi:hypothetical protein